jgi:hypothetical protein
LNAISTYNFYVIIESGSRIVVNCSLIMTKTTAFRWAHFRVICIGEPNGGNLIASKMGPENVNVILSDGYKIDY